MEAILGLLACAAFALVSISAIAEALRKAGFSRWWGLLLLLLGPIAVLIFAFKEWPVQREAAWSRLREGATSEDVIARVERYALDLEKAGHWKMASRVYEELSRRTPSESGDYYANCAKRLSERLGELA